MSPGLDIHQRQAGRGEPKEADHVEFIVPSRSCASARGFLHAASRRVKAGTRTLHGAARSCSRRGQRSQNAPYPHRASHRRRSAPERRSRIDWPPGTRHRWHPRHRTPWVRTSSTCRSSPPLPTIRTFATPSPDHPDFTQKYASNVALYPTFQEYFRTQRPPLLAAWGKNDPFFLPSGAEAFKRDIPGAVVRFFDTGHFALETHAAEIAAAIRGFLAP